MIQRNEHGCVVGLDIGGANLKIADDLGRCSWRSFAMWQQHAELAETLAEMLDELPAAAHGIRELAVTMTGELADCFPTRRSGVAEILDAVVRAAPRLPCVVYGCSGQWVSPADAKSQAWEVAASNWHALANWIASGVWAERSDRRTGNMRGRLNAPPETVSAGGRCADRQPAEPPSSEKEEAPPRDIVLVVDIGSTTIDVVPVKDGRVATPAVTDRQRMQRGQLLYTGIERTPLPAIVREFRLAAESCPVMAECFATSRDAYLVRGLLAEQPHNCDSADGRPQTIACAVARLARSIGEDVETLPAGWADRMAEQLIEAQTQQLADCLRRNLPPMSGRPHHVVVAGHGGELYHQAIRHLRREDIRTTCLGEWVGPAASRCAPAVAVAQLRAAALRKAKA